MACDARRKVELVMALIKAIVYVYIGQVYFRLGDKRMRRVTRGTFGNACGILFIMRHVPVRIDRLIVFGLEDCVRSD